MFLYIKTNILRGYGIFKNDFAHPREPATATGDESGTCGKVTPNSCIIKRDSFIQVNSGMLAPVQLLSLIHI